MQDAATSRVAKLCKEEVLRKFLCCESFGAGGADAYRSLTSMKNQKRKNYKN